MAGYSTPAWTNNSSPAISASALTSLGQAVELAEHPYGICTTAASTAAKEVTIDYSGTLSLFTGMTVRVRFTNANTAQNPTLNVNGTGANSIIYGTGANVGTAWIAGAVVQFTYNGSEWVIAQPLGLDAAPTQNSANLVNSGGIYAGLLNMKSATGTDNLLDNAYFGGGGSQQAYSTVVGPLPINQRGETTYSTTSSSGMIYTIDRFRITNGKVTVNTDSINVALGNGQTPRQRFSQTINGKLHNGDIITFSAVAKINTNSGNSLLMAMSNAGGNIIVSQTISGTTSAYTLISATFTLSADIANPVFEIMTNTSSTSKLVDIDIKAMKVEPGSQQTLAHQESGTWIINAIPDYSAEMLKCNAKLFAVQSDIARCTIYTANSVYFDFFAPTDILSAAQNGTIIGVVSGGNTGTLSLKGVNNASGTQYSGFTFAVSRLGSRISVSATKTGHGLTDAVLTTGTTGKVLLSFED